MSELTKEEQYKQATEAEIRKYWANLQKPKKIKGGEQG